MRLIANTAADVWARIDKSATCWFWTGQITRPGYGTISMGGKKLLTHRLMWEMHHGPIPPGLFVCHHCDVRHCVNPDHLFLGTVQDNQRDALRKGRLHGPNKRGEDLPMTRLTLEQVLAIRREYVPFKVGYVRLARKYGVAPKTIADIISGHSWKESFSSSSPPQECSSRP